MSAQRTVLVTVLGAALVVSACNKAGSSAEGDKTVADKAPVNQAGAAAAVLPDVPGVRVVVDGKGFTPSKIAFEKGKSGTVTFVRTSDETCATKVVFPELNIKKDLPLNQPVSVDLPTADARSYVFQCGMGMYKSSVVVN